MTAVLLRLRAEIRARWKAWLALAVLSGVVGGVAVAALAGARRTETAYQRFLAGTGAADVLLTNGGTTADNLNRQFSLDQLAGLPQVAQVVPMRYYAPEGSTAAGRRITQADFSPFAPVDGRWGSEVDRPRILEGRLPRGDREIALPFFAADRLGVTVGDRLRLRLLLAAAPPGTPEAPTEDVDVVGLLAVQGGFPPLTGGLPPPALLSPSYASSHPGAAEVFAVRLRRGRAAITSFEDALDRLAHGEQVVTSNQTEESDVVQRGLAVEATTLRILAAVVAGVALLLLGQAFVRAAFVEADDYPTLRALGASRGQLRSVAAARAAAIAVAAGVFAAVAAVALSPLTPVGVARQAELHPGAEVNVAYLGAGAAAVSVLVFLLAAWPAWRFARAAGASRRQAGSVGSRLAAALNGTALPPPATCGVHMALEPGRGRTAVPVRATIVSIVLAVAVVTATVTFSASLGRIYGDPRLYGWNWDIQVGDSFSPPSDGAIARYAADPAVSAVAAATIARVQIGSVRVDALASEPVRGTVEPVVIQGRAPRAPDEILLGSRTLRALGRRVGDTVTVELGDGRARMTVVGRGVLTEFAGAAGLGRGAALTLDGLRRLNPEASADVAMVRVRAGPEGRRFVDRLTAAAPGNLYLPSKPSDLADLERVGGLPSAVAGLVAGFAVVTLAQMLVVGVRRRQRDLSVLKVLGFTTGQVSAAVAWQASVVTLLCAAAGLPLGVAAGRWAWREFADRLGVPAHPVVPVALFAAVAGAGLVLANLAAAVPARLAASTRPARVLRSE
ncbi:MAG TPA: ABC transporter permease [Acidimicrobiales bacterium]|nr:ABC transporter permease [Acidimicrobiales bacterium]